MPSRADTVHLLRRTEVVARPERVAELEPLTLEEAVDNVLDVPADPGSVAFSSDSEWQRHVELTHFWLNRLARAARPLQEQLAVFWHGHFVSSADKVGIARLTREQIDLYRHRGLGNVRDLAITMSTQVAMLRYLDNNQNRRSSPNQNFGRELMELFLLGVGNYTESDVEACTAAWTGHGDYWEDGAYVWHDDWHDERSKQFLGRTINTVRATEADRRQHGAETIQVMLGNGTVPAGATNAANRGRPSREVAAEFLSRKLWTFFAGTTPSNTVVAALRNVLLANDFEVRPWLRALLLRSEFYGAEVKAGLVRSPTDYIVSLLVATGLTSEEATPTWLLDAMGQRLLYPPNVSGWRNNGAYVSAGALGARASVARRFAWLASREYWDDNGDRSINLAGGSIHQDDIKATGKAWNAGFDDKAAERRAIVDRMADLAGIDLTTSRAALHKQARNSEWWELNDLLPLLFLAPEMQVS